jgi:hypothetical protein
MLSPLPVIGVGNSNNQVPAGSYIRLSGDRGDGGGPINEDIGPSDAAATRVFDTTRSDGL